MNEEEAKKADRKSARNTYIVVVVAVILAFAVIAFTVAKLKCDSDRENQFKEDMLRGMAYMADASYRADVAHDNYTSNPMATSLFNNITATYSFLVAQTKILFTDMDVLTNNVTIPNYYTAWKQYLLCNIINKAYEQNFSEYSVVIKTFIWMDYLHYDDVVYFDDEPPQSTMRIGNAGYWVRNYTLTLKAIENKLDFINGVLDVVYTG